LKNGEGHEMASVIVIFELLFLLWLQD
jgi:hypothetical protein